MSRFLCVLPLLCYLWQFSMAQSTPVEGIVTDGPGGQPIPGASLRFTGSNSSGITDRDGRFSISVSSLPDTLVISCLGYAERRLPLLSMPAGMLRIELEPDIATLKEVVVSTGFYQVPKERATGSFTHIDNKLFNRDASPNILDRLEGVTNGLYFDRNNILNENRTEHRADLRVRGIATIESDDSPLIVLDNFPYEDDLNKIDPDNIESITILKDAAAASIWGARAGNGVIVITTKQGRYNQKARISFNSSLTIGDKPDLFYNQNFLPSEAVMDIERRLFEQGQFRERDRTPIPAFVELLIAKRDGLIDDAEFARQEQMMRETDVRDEALKYLYQPSLLQQYSLDVSGGGKAYRYYLSAGYDKNRERVVNNGSSRLNLRLRNTFQPLKNLELTAGIWYSRQEDRDNGLLLSGLSGASVSPYIRLTDGQGNALPIVKDYRFTYTARASENGLLDWQYRPLDEIGLADETGSSSELRMDGSLSYRFLDGLDLRMTYQYLWGNSGSKTYYAPETYYVRSLVNRFTQEDGTQIIPYGGIMDSDGTGETTSHSGRLQLNYDRSFGDAHSVTGLAGAEIRQHISRGEPGYTIYNYNPDQGIGTTLFDYDERYSLRPSGSDRIDRPGSARSQITDRFLSYFGNAAYTYSGRYTLSGSIRWDGSNIFGVKTNQKGVPLWSVGGSWELSRENFYHWNLFPYLRLRATYGIGGNVNKSVSVYPVISYSFDNTSGLPDAYLKSTGNPNLRWEKVKTINLGLDFESREKRVQGSVEYYVKNASDLIGLDYMDPTTGIIEGAVPIVENKINYADLKTHGVDVQLSTSNLRGKINWRSSVLFSFVRNEITHFNTAELTSISSYLGSAPPPAKGKSRDVIYALPWNGLDHDTGLPVVFLDGVASTEYNDYYNSYPVSDLLLAGVRVPPFFGSLRNTLSWKGLELSANIIWKAGHVFRRNSMRPAGEYIDLYHMDYFKRWQRPGDESFTQVPARVDEYNATARALNSIYSESMELISPGDHIRLHDVSLSYTIRGEEIGQLPLQRIRLFVYARNLGILWRANKQGLDPDYPSAHYPEPRSFAFGIQVDL